VVASPEQVAFLKQFHLSESQAKAYVALLDLGLTDAREVSRLSGVPVGRVYHVLEQLKEKGLVIVIPDSPRRYRPVPVEEFVDAQRAQLDAQAARLDASKREAQRLLVAASRAEVDDRGSVSIFRGRLTASQKMRGLVSAAKQDVVYVAPPGMGRRGVLSPLLAQAAAHGVRARAILPDAAGMEPLVREHGSLVEFRRRSVPMGLCPPTGTLVVDSRVALLVHFVPDDATPLAKDLGLVVEERALVETLASLVEAAWSASAPW
jgi:HTH-type transcriptional regulator, sugar sensing transcriptional regulator